MSRDLVAHDVSLLKHFFGKWLAASGRSFVHHHGQWGFQSMGQIADMRAGSLYDLSIRFNQSVGFSCKRSNFFGERPREAFSAARTYSCQAVCDPFKRGKAEANLKHSGEQQHRSKNGKGNNEGLVEGAHFVGNLGGVARNRNEVTAFVAEVDISLNEPQPLILRPRHIPLAGAIGASGNTMVLQVRQTAIPKRSRRSHFAFLAVQPSDLPIPPRQRQFEQWLAKRLRKFFVSLFWRSNIGHQRTQVNAEAAVERALDRLPVQ